MPKVAILLSMILLSSLLVNSSYGFLGGDLLQQNTFSPKIKIQQTPEIVKISPLFSDQQETMKRYLIFGTDSLYDAKLITKDLLNGIQTQNGFFSVVVLPENKIQKLESNGFYVIEDFLLDFHSTQDSQDQEISQIGKILGSDEVHQRYDLDGSGVTIAIVDTGVDFSNPDIQHSLARDDKNKPIMLDADGQGIILTNATFVANIDKNGILRNYTKSLPENMTSSVYKTRDGVFMDLVQEGEGTTLQIYNSFFPQAGFSPIFNGTIINDMKIGQNNRDYIVSKSGIYHLGVMYQGSLQGSLARIQAVPVLVVDSTTAGLYDTIIPDMSTSWEDYTRFDLERGQEPDYDFDFTDETPIKIGDGNEFLVYDFDDDGKFDTVQGLWELKEVTYMVLFKIKNH